MTGQVVRGQVRGRGWCRVSHGLYRSHRDPDGSQPGGSQPDLQAWQLVLPGSAAFTHLTAALAYRWWLPPIPADLPVFVAMSHAEPRPRRHGLVVCRHPQPFDVRRPDTDRAGRGDPLEVPLTTPAETLLAAGRDLGILDLVVLADAALHQGDCTLAELQQISLRRRRGAPALRRALPWVDSRSESAWETVSRVFHRACGIPVEPQYEVRDDAGRLIARADLRITGTRRLYEYDGAAHRSPGQHARDLRRDRELQGAGWQRYGYTCETLLHHAVSVLRDADAALGRRHRPDRVRRWHRLLADSMFTPAGTARLRHRWRLPGAAENRFDETGHGRPGS